MPRASQLSTPNPHRTRIGEPGYRTWRAMVEATGGCTHPIRMSGQWGIQDIATGQMLDHRAGYVFTPCGNRRESVCPACSDRYAADAFHLLRAGLSGGTKGVPETVTEKPRLFLTLTAPSFGPVHNRRTSTNGKTMPCRCGDYHHPDDPRIGQPLDPDGYDYAGHVLWQAHAGELWSRFCRYLKRHIAQTAGLRVREFNDHARLSFAKVAEYQRRGLIHFHAVIRLDGPDGPADATPTWGSTELLTHAAHAAHNQVRLTSPKVNEHTWNLAFGEQIDIKPIRPAHASQVENEQGVITDDRIASYVAKYATKGTSISEGADKPIRSQDAIDQLDVNEHHRRIIQTAWNLGAPEPCPDCHPDCGSTSDGTGCSCTYTGYCDTCGDGSDTCGDGSYIPGGLAHLNLRRWAHMLAFRGHFLSKSKAYSTTFQRLRDDRHQYRHEHALEDLGITDESTIAVINDWQMTSVGHRSPEQRELAEAIAHRQRQARKDRHATERKD